MAKKSKMSELSGKLESESDSEIVNLIEDEGAPSTKKLGASTSNRELTRIYESTEFKIVQDRNDFLLHQILDFVDQKKWINLTPDYQRRKRWDNRKKSLLIESLLMNLPVPPVFLFEVDPNRYEVMDGQQRLNAIIEFYSDQLALTGLESWSGLEGRKYTECPPRIQRGIDRRKISAVILSADTSNKDGLDSHEIRREVFERLNTGGEKLNAQELRNCLYSGPLNDAIIELSREEVFTTAWGIPSFSRYENGKASVVEPRKSNRLYRTMADTQIVLRFFAFRNTKFIRGSVRSMLDGYMKKNRHISSGELAELSGRFRECLSLAREIFGDSMFRLPASKGSKLSVPLYDAEMIAIDSLLQHQKLLRRSKRSIVDGVAKAVENPAAYQVLIGKPNTASAIQKRIASVQKIMSKSIGG